MSLRVQQTAAQPFASALGDPATGTSRITLGGAINSFGTTIGPLVIALALFGTAKAISDEEIAALGLSKVIILYCCVGALFIAAASLFHFSKKVPAGIIKEPTEKATKAFYGLLIMSGLLIIMFVPVIESTPEVRKAGGVYYNPEYIVNYIVEKTVGERLKKCNTFEDLLKIF